MELWIHQCDKDDALDVLREIRRYYIDVIDDGGLPTSALEFTLADFTALERVIDIIERHENED